MYPVGANLTAVERKLGFPHKPIDRKGKVLCYNFRAHSGCGKGDQCTFSHLQRIRPEGMRWAAQYDLARRGELASEKRIEPNAVGGYLQALRTHHVAELKKSIEESRGAVVRKLAPDCNYAPSPHGLKKVAMNGVTRITPCSESMQQCNPAAFVWKPEAYTMDSSHWQPMCDVDAQEIQPTATNGMNGSTVVVATPGRI